MIVYSLLIITLLLATTALLILSRCLHKHTRSCWPAMAVGVSLAAFIYLYGAWLFLSVYCKYLFGIAVFGLLAACMFVRKRPQDQPRHMGINLILAVVLGVFVVLYHTGTGGKPYGVAELAFPFKSGSYIVFQGGKGLPTNLFHAGRGGSKYAMDVVKLNKAGNRASNIFSKQLTDYEIYGDTIYSPCSGRVIKVKDDNPDNIPPDRTRGPSNTNQVLIETSSLYVFMGHLQQHSVFVHEGDEVKQGQPIGCVGNSGYSLEPHLHMQVHAKTDDALPWYKKKQLLIQFDGKSYLLFEIIKTR